jgi:hypothetical protein
VRQADPRPAAPIAGRIDPAPPGGDIAMTGWRPPGDLLDALADLLLEQAQRGQRRPSGDHLPADQAEDNDQAAPRG